MVSERSLKRIGKVKEAFGLQGELYILIFSKEVSWKDRLKMAVLEDPKTHQQIHLKSENIEINKHKDGVRLKSSLFSDRTAAEKIKGYYFLVPEDLFVSQPGEGIYLNEIHGFKVFTKDESLGVVTGFSSNGAQDLLVVSIGPKTCEIPFVEPFIIEINFDEKHILMDLPEGLIDLNQR